MSTTIIHPVILIGGSGTRLWPLSRANYPKQFNKFLDNYSLFQNTILRLKKIQNIGGLILVVSESNYFICLDQLCEINVHDAKILVEPIGKNTAPAIAVAAKYIQQHYNDHHLILVLPSDHQINDAEKFAQTIHDTADFASKKLILFGVTPSAPATSYGYIQAISDEKPAKVERFIEKPNAENAEQLFQRKNCYWNSGMFFFSVKTILQEMELHTPEIVQLAEQALHNAINQGCTWRFSDIAFSQMPNVPFDIAVMEKTKNAYVFPLQSDWSDLGDWKAIYETNKPDDNGNVVIGKVLSHSTTNSFLHSNSKLITTVGIDNLVVVSTKDSVLVAEKNKVQDVKALVELLKSGEYAKHAHHDLKVFHPWGSCENLIQLDTFQVKHIVVNPGKQLSLQSHRHQSGHWIVVKGIATVTCDKKTFKVHENQSTYIHKETPHRLTNHQDTSLHLIEVQVGECLGEDDIVQLDEETAVDA